MLVITRDGQTRLIKDVYEFHIDVSSSGDAIHIYLNAFYRLRKRQLLETAPRWRRNDERFSTIDYVEVPDDVTQEVLQMLRDNLILHYPERETPRV
jgi:hypothetical protein